MSVIGDFELAGADSVERWRALAHAVDDFEFRGPSYDAEPAEQWQELLEALAAVEHSDFALLGRPAFVDDQALFELQREAEEASAAGDAARYNEIVNGQGFSGPGPAAQRMALDLRWPELIKATLGIDVRSSREAGYIHYNRPGAHVAPHVDGMGSDVNLLLTIDRHPDRGDDRSAVVVYPPRRHRIRAVLERGEAIAIQGRGLVHAREAVRPGERVRILCMGFTHK
jgi:hypothetical protein